MKSSLVPEKPITVTPSLAATIGLEEAVMLSVLADLGPTAQTRPNNGYVWLSIETQRLAEATPFWDAREIQRVCQSLRDKGILLVGSAHFGAEATFKFAYNERATASTPAAHRTPIVSVPQNTQHPNHGAAQRHQAGQMRREPEIRAEEAQRDEISHTFGKNYLGANWRPSADTLAQLAQHSIPQQFTLEQLPNFITYWRERREAHRSWGAKFVQHVIFKWRDFESKRNQKDQATRMESNWQPSLDALDVLTVHAGISRGFVEDAIPEFVLYWQERGDVLKTWNSKFIQHVRLQWKKYNSTVEHSTDPKPIPENWQPSNDVCDVLRLANIDLAFAQSVLPEFVLYWRDSKQAHTSWNTRFLQHVKHHWAKRLANGGQSNNPTNAPQRSTREISIEEQLTDRSWAV